MHGRRTISRTTSLTLPPSEVRNHCCSSAKSGTSWARPPPPWCNFGWLDLKNVLCIWSQVLWIHVPVMSIKSCFTAKHNFCLWGSFCPLFWNNHWALAWGGVMGMRVWYREPFTAKHSSLIYISVCWLVMSLCINKIYYKKRFLWWELTAVLIYGHKDKNRGYGLLLYPFRRMIVISGSLLQPMTWPAMAFWPSNSIGHEFLKIKSESGWLPP